MTLYLGGNCKCCFHGCIGVCHTFLVLFAALGAWIAFFDCDFVRIAQSSVEDDDGFGILSFGATPELKLGIWKIQNGLNLFNPLGSNPFNRCQSWGAINSFALSDLPFWEFDFPHKFARGVGMTIFAVSLPFMIMGWCLNCCVMNKITTHVMAGISFLLSILTALLTVFLASSLCETLDCSLSIDFYICIGSSVVWFLAGVVIVFARDKEEVIRRNTLKVSQAGAAIGGGVEQPMMMSQEEVLVERVTNADGSITEVTKKVMKHPDGSESTTQTSSRVVDDGAGLLDPFSDSSDDSDSHNNEYKPPPEDLDAVLDDSDTF